MADFQNYLQDFFFIIFLLNLSIGVFIYLMNPEKPLNKKFAFLCFLFSFWILCNYLMGATKLIIFLQASYFIACFLGHFAYVFSLELCEQKVSSFYIRLSFCLSVFFASCSFTPLLLASVDHVELGRFEGEFGPILPMLVIYLIIIVGGCISVVLNEYKKSKGIKKIQLKYIVAGFIITGVGMVMVNGILPLMGYNEWMFLDSIFASFYCVFAAFSVIRYRFMDIRIAFTKAGLFLLVYTLVLGIPFYIGYKTDSWIMATYVSLILATIGPYTYRFIYIKTHRSILQKQKHYQKVLLESAKELQNQSTSENIIIKMLSIIDDLIELEFMAMFVYHNDEQYNLYTLPHHMKKCFNQVRIKETHRLINYIRDHDKAFYYDEIPFDIKDIVRDSHEVNLIFPMKRKQQLLGFIIMGNKKNYDAFSQEDINVLNIFSNHGALALENSQFLQNQQDIQLKLFRADKLSSLGILSSGVAHEINNPNNNILFNTKVLKKDYKYLKSILDDYAEKYGDFPVNGYHYSDIKDKIISRFESIETDVKRIQHISEDLKGFVKNNRHTGFRWINIKDVVQSAVGMMEFHIHKKTCDFEIIHEDDLPKVFGDFHKLEQVIVNLIQNACQAITSIHQAIRIFVYFKKKQLVIEVKDQGPGMSESVLKKAREPFFTTKNESQGTGLGLYITSKIIEEHEGKIEIISSPGQGTLVKIIFLKLLMDLSQNNLKESLDEEIIPC